MEARVLALAGDAMLARRLVDWIREAFGTVLVSHLGKQIEFSPTFEARDARGQWRSIPYSAEPIFAVAVAISRNLVQQGHGAKFEQIVLRSSVFNSVNNALNAGASLDHLVIGGPAVVGIPAEIYLAVKKPWSERFFPWLGRLPKRG